jgi:o-succinylbenzoate synthase
MHIAEVIASTVEVPFRQPFVSGTMRWEQRRLTLLSLRTDTGLVGLGEFAAPVPHDLGADLSSALVASLHRLELSDPVSLETALRDIEVEAFVGRVARGAVESALTDLMARVFGESVADRLSAVHASRVAVNGLIGLLPAGDAAELAAGLLGHGYRTLKLKCGDEAPDVLRDRVAAVRDAVGDQVSLRLDFNGGLPTRRAAAVIETLAPFGLEYVEQPISPTAGVVALARLRRQSAVPLAADESVRDLGSARELIETGAVDAIVVKPARVGGLRQASGIAALATGADVAVTVSTLFETGIGIAGALHLASTIPGSHAHGLATASLLESDLLLEPLDITDGRMTLPPGPGLGVQLDPDAVARYLAA